MGKLDKPDGWDHQQRKIWAIQYLDLEDWKSSFCVGFEGAQFDPAKVVYYVQRFQVALKQKMKVDTSISKPFSTESPRQEDLLGNSETS